jgi:hypothetical protein
MAESYELELSELTTDGYQAWLAGAIDSARDQDKVTWLTENGRRIAAIVPVDAAEAHEAMAERAMSTPVGRPRVRYPDVTVCLSTGCDGNTGAIMAAVTSAMTARGVPAREIREFRQAVFGCSSYQNVLKLVMKTVNVE